MKKFDLPSPFRLTAAVVAGAATLWAFGFLVFFLYVASAKPEHPAEPRDVVIVLTGGPNRIEQGFDLMAQNSAKAMLVTGVHPDVTLEQLLMRWPADEKTKAALSRHCCIFIEHKAESTEDNAAEALGWLNRNGGPKDVKVRLVTSDYHMPRALLLFHRAMPETKFEAWPVPSAKILSTPFIRTVFIEYSKTLLTLIS